MKALVKVAAGPGHVAIQDVPVRDPGPEDLLIRVKYCGICGTDLHIHADEFPNDPPVIMGHEYCGTVVQVGTGVRGEWAVGERVVGELHTGACGTCALCLAGKPHICDRKLALGSRHDGAFAEYLTLPAWLAHRVPDGLPWEVAAVTEPFAISTHCLVERVPGRPGQTLDGAQSILITGAATMGLMAIIWASRLGVRNIVVTGTDLDVPVRFVLAQQLGATRVVNVQREDLAPVVADLTAGAGVDVWVECSGSQRAIAQGIELVKKTGRVVLIGLVGPETVPVPWNRLLYKELDLVGCFSSPPSSWEKALAVEAEEADKLRKLATHSLPLEEWERGFAMMRTGEAVKILIDMQREEA